MTRERTKLDGPDKIREITDSIPSTYNFSYTCECLFTGNQHNYCNPASSCLGYRLRMGTNIRCHACPFASRDQEIYLPRTGRPRNPCPVQCPWWWWWWWWWGGGGGGYQMVLIGPHYPAPPGRISPEPLSSATSVLTAESLPIFTNFLLLRFLSGDHLSSTSRH